MADELEDTTPSPTQAENDAAILAARGLKPAKAAKKGKDDADEDDADAEVARKAKEAGEVHAAHAADAKTRAVPTGGENPSFKNR